MPDGRPERSWPRVVAPIRMTLKASNVKLRKSHSARNPRRSAKFTLGVKAKVMVGHVARIQAYNEFDLLPAIAIEAYDEQDLRELARSQPGAAGGLRTRPDLQRRAQPADRRGRGALVRALDTPACVAYLATLQPKVPYLASIAVLDLEGQVACRQEPPRRTFASRIAPTSRRRSPRATSLSASIRTDASRAAGSTAGPAVAGRSGRRHRCRRGRTRPELADRAA